MTVAPTLLLLAVLSQPANADAPRSGVSLQLVPLAFGAVNAEYERALPALEASLSLSVGFRATDLGSTQAVTFVAGSEFRRWLGGRLWFDALAGWSGFGVGVRVDVARTSLASVSALTAVEFKPGLLYRVTVLRRVCVTTALHVGVRQDLQDAAMSINLAPVATASAALGVLF